MRDISLWHSTIFADKVTQFIGYHEKNSICRIHSFHSHRLIACSKNIGDQTDGNDPYARNAQYALSAG